MSTNYTPAARSSCLAHTMSAAPVGRAPPSPATQLKRAWVFVCVCVRDEALLQHISVGLLCNTSNTSKSTATTISCKIVQTCVTKEPHVSAEKRYVSTKEPYIPAKEPYTSVHEPLHLRYAGLALVSRIDKIIGLFGRILSLLWGSFEEETYNFIDPTNCSHLIPRLCRPVGQAPLSPPRSYKHVLRQSPVYPQKSPAYPQKSPTYPIPRLRRYVGRVPRLRQTWYCRNRAQNICCNPYVFISLVIQVHTHRKKQANAKKKYQTTYPPTHKCTPTHPSTHPTIHPPT